MRVGFPIALIVLLAASCAHQQPVVTQQFSVDGGSLEYRVSGRGAPVLLIHGSLFADAFAPMLNDSAISHYQFITWHRRGYAGSSPAPANFTIAQQSNDALALLDHLGIKRAHVVGHSYGGDIALQLAADHPDRVASLTLLEPALFITSPETQDMMSDLAAAAMMHAKGDDRAAITRFVASVVGSDDPAAIDKQLGAGAFDHAVATAPAFFNVEVPSLQTWTFTVESAKSIRIATLLVAGSDSRRPFKATVNTLRRVMPDAEEAIIPGAPHALEITYPSAAAEAISGFLERHPIR